MARSSANGIHTVAILGGGPAASTLAVLLARAGCRVGLWHKPKAASLIVGESLVPAVIPMLRQLDVEDEVREFSMLKPGATFNLSPELAFSFSFENLRGLPRYAYNVPRDKFDAMLLDTAQKAGAKIFAAPAEVTRVAGTDRVELSPATLAEAGNWFGGAPDLIVDATGRARLIPNLLGIPSRAGQRKDTALFAHLDTTRLDHEGHVHTTRLDRGWSWRIPLPDRVSVGMVVPTERLQELGPTPEMRFDNLLSQEAALRAATAGAKRLTPVLEYANYQLVSERMVGSNWALVGDTAGFIDPVFSSGLFLGMQGAFLLADAIQQGTPSALQRYERATRHHLEIWHEIVDYWYNGRLFTCFKVGEKRRDTWLVKMISPHLSKHLGRIFGGAASQSAYSIGLLRFAMKYGLEDEDPEQFRVK